MPNVDTIAHRQILATKSRLDSLEIAWGKNHEKLLSALNELADLYFALGQYAFAEELYWRALSIVCRSKNTDDMVIATCLKHVAEALHAQERFDEAERIYLWSYQAISSSGAEKEALTAVLARMATLYKDTDASVKATWTRLLLKERLAS